MKVQSLVEVEVGLNREDVGGKREEEEAIEEVEFKRALRV